MPARLVRQILTELTQCGMVSEVKVSEKTETCYQPAHDISTITVAAVIEALENHGGSSLPVNRTDELQMLERQLDRFRSLVAEASENRLLSSL
jgi:membrane protein